MTIALMSDGWLSAGPTAYRAMDLMSGGWLYVEEAGDQPDYQEPTLPSTPPGAGLQFGGGAVPTRKWIVPGPEISIRDVTRRAKTISATIGASSAKNAFASKIAATIALVLDEDDG